MELSEILSSIGSIVWGPVMSGLLVGTGIYLTIRLRFVQILYLKHAIKCISGVYDNPDEEGDISHFKALCAALSATIGTGNIAGVGTAIAVGGPGAVFWMWITAIFGMATKFTSCSLALHYREINKDGSSAGGPMYYLEKGFAPQWLTALGGEIRTKRWAITLAMSFAILALIASFGIGNMVQANSVVDGLKYVMPDSWSEPGFSLFGFQISYFSLSIGLILACMVAMVILGGIKRIANVASKLVPGMSVIYVLGALIILFLNIDGIANAFALIFKHAFTPFAAGGGVAGIAVMTAIKQGVARGVFSNESGLGSAPMAHAAAKTQEVAREGFVAMLGPLIDTLIICTMTALVIIVTGASTSGMTSSSLTAHAFDLGLFGFGHHIVGFGLMLFAYSTMISWSYYGDRCAQYIFGSWAIPFYRVLFVLLIVVGAVGGLQMIWAIADIMNACMAIPNLIGLLALGGVAAAYTKNYIQRLEKGEF
ncbi:MAG: sodium:alanine symporter family protein [Calditrichaeota bacterium]|nr:sodium:alanine symporter family protein [Calditrichota bacterium]MBT7787473.1 sodium:alanine symporter family protein [Calditrichota bacterium]